MFTLFITRLPLLLLIFIILSSIPATSQDQDDLLVSASVRKNQYFQIRAPRPYGMRNTFVSYGEARDKSIIIFPVIGISSLVLHKGNDTDNLIKEDSTGQSINGVYLLKHPEKLTVMMHNYLVIDSLNLLIKQKIIEQMRTADPSLQILGVCKDPIYTKPTKMQLLIDNEAIIEKDVNFSNDNLHYLVSFTLMPAECDKLSKANVSSVRVGFVYNVDSIRTFADTVQHKLPTAFLHKMPLAYDSPSIEYTTDALVINIDSIELGNNRWVFDQSRHTEWGKRKTGFLGTAKIKIIDTMGQRDLLKSIGIWDGILKSLNTWAGTFPSVQDDSSIAEWSGFPPNNICKINRTIIVPLKNEYISLDFYLDTCFTYGIHGIDGIYGIDNSEQVSIQIESPDKRKFDTSLQSKGKILSWKWLGKDEERCNGRLVYSLSYTRMPIKSQPLVF